MSGKENDLSTELIRSIADLRDQEVMELVRQRIARGDDPTEIIEDCRQGMILVGTQYEQGRYYISGLILAGEILREIMEIIQPVTERKYSGKSQGVVLLGTVEMDIHDLGKDLLKIYLRAHGFTVHDLGVDVPPVEFVSKARELSPDVIGLSCLIVGAYRTMKDTVSLLQADPETHAIPIIIGGRVNSRVCKLVEADHWTTDAMEGVRWCQQQVSTKLASNL